MKILNIGSLNLDYIYGLPHIVKLGETLTAASLSTAAGGKGLNQSIALARAGAQVSHAGCYGEAGEQLKKLLEANGVNTELLTRTDEPQGNAIIQVEESGNNSIIVFGGSNRCLTRAQIDMIIAGFDRGDMLILQNEVNDIGYITKRAAEAGLQVVLNPSPFDAAIADVDMNDLRWLIMNEVESECLTGTQDARKAHELLSEKYPELGVIITLGTRGAYCFDGGEVVFQKAYEVRAVDTTAAGDTFTGYFFASLAAGKPLAECMRLASVASAISVTRPGASPSVPLYGEVVSAGF